MFWVGGWSKFKFKFKFGWCIVEDFFVVNVILVLILYR